MSGRRRLQYDKGPSLEEESRETAGSDGSADERKHENDSKRNRSAVAPRTAGVGFGAGAFAVGFAVNYQLTGARIAAGTLTAGSDGPSRWIVAGLTMLSSHGGTIQHGDEPIRLDRMLDSPLATDITALIPIALLVLAGYLLGRFVRVERRAETAISIGTAALSYVALVIALAFLATWTPDGRRAARSGPGSEAIAVAVDAPFVASAGVSALLFVTVGAVVAALPGVIARSGSKTTDTDGTT